mmetsp:Transcript_6575/g.12087  ORF Transcript_6575/g.12087 Transcript_6575/m.12087 type:complete len:103 (+) Transcript_6575:2240-2548(+)
MSKILQELKKEELYQKDDQNNLLKNWCGYNTKTIVRLKNGHNFIGFLRSFDKHKNLIVEDVVEIWQEKRRMLIDKSFKIITRSRYESSIFLRGDSVSSLSHA